MECGEDGCEVKTESCDMKECALHRCKMFGGRCAYSVSKGELDVKGNLSHKFIHDGHVYYFSSEEKKQSFKKNLDENVKKAHKHWDAFQWQQWRK